MAADLVTLSVLRTFLGIDPTDTRDDAKYTALIPAASDLIRSWTERDFGAPVVTEERTYEYDGSGYLEIDDASAVTSVVLTYPDGSLDITLDAQSWTAKPFPTDNAPLYTYIEMPGYMGAVPGSPEMGFKRNLDVYARERGLYGIPNRVKVTGTWGWAAVPADVQLAATWIVQSWATRPSSDNLTSEAIEGWSRSWGNRTAGGAQMAVPDVVRDLLAPYAKIDL